MTTSADPICVASPKWTEWLIAAAVYPLAAFMVTAFVSFGIDAVFPTFLTEDHAANRWRMALIFFPVAIGLIAATHRANRSRVYRLFEDRLEIGRPSDCVVQLADIRRVRVGAPPPSLVRKVGRVNEVLGRVKAANAGAARHLKRQYARTVVLDLGEGERQVINLATVNRGEELLAALLGRLVDRVETPPTYSDDELAVFGRFVPGRYRCGPSSGSAASVFGPETKA